MTSVVMVPTWVITTLSVIAVVLFIIGVFAFIFSLASADTGDDGSGVAFVVFLVCLLLFVPLWGLVDGPRLDVTPQAAPKVYKLARPYAEPRDTPPIVPVEEPTK